MDTSESGLANLRNAVLDLASVAVRLPDEAMDRPYAWREYNEDGLRFALLTAYHDLLDLSVRLEAARTPLTQAQRILAGFIDAHADLAGVLISTSDAEIDRAPAEKEWPLRRVIDHLLDSEHGFLTACRRGLKLAGEGKPPLALTNQDWASFGRPAKAEGEREEVQPVLLGSRDAVVAEFRALPDGALETPVDFWEAEVYPLRFRLIRFELHLRQHIIQADKTMAGIGHPPSEAERLVRLVMRGLGRVEAALVGAPAAYGREDLSRSAVAISALRDSVGAAPA